MVTDTWSYAGTVRTTLLSFKPHDDRADSRTDMLRMSLLTSHGFHTLGLVVALSRGKMATLTPVNQGHAALISQSMFLFFSLLYFSQHSCVIYQSGWL